MNVYVSGSGSSQPVTLEQRDFVFPGGEGKVFIKGNVAYKIYHDPAKTIEPGRLAELQTIRDPRVIKPDAMILDARDRPIGYTMQAVPNALPLSRLFTNEFRQQNNLGDAQVIDLVQQMRDTLAALHDQDILVVDGNEMNYLVSDDFSQVFFIDVDSYQTRSFPAKAFSDATLDPNVDLAKNNFTPGSDWFAFAIVACQLLLGIHPFKGTYTGTQFKFKRRDMAARMQAGVSIFNADVRVNSAVRDFNLIPDNYRAWFEQLFEQGLRQAAPAQAGAMGIAAAVQSVLSGQVITIKELLTGDSTILAVYGYQQKRAWKTQDQFVVEGGARFSYRDPETQLVFAPRSLTPLLMKVEDGALMVYNTETQAISREDFALKRCFVYQNRVYGLGAGYLHEFSLMETAQGIKILSSVAEAVMPLSTECFDNLLIQHMLGATYLTIPFEAGAIAQLRVPELEGKRILNAKYDNGLIGIIWYDKGTYQRALLKLNASFTSYSWFQERETDDLTLNFAVLENGIAVDQPEDGQLQVFDVRVGKDGIKQVNDDQVRQTLQLTAQGMNLIGLSGTQAVKLSLG